MTLPLPLRVDSHEGRVRVYIYLRTAYGLHNLNRRSRVLSVPVIYDDAVNFARISLQQLKVVQKRLLIDASVEDHLPGLVLASISSRRNDGPH